MPLNYTEICELIEQGVVENADFKNVNSSSLDITLGRDIFWNGIMMSFQESGRNRFPFAAELRWL
jgi:hypothetical protein